MAITVLVHVVGEETFVAEIEEMPHRMKLAGKKTVNS